MSEVVITAIAGITGIIVMAIIQHWFAQRAMTNAWKHETQTAREAKRQDLIDEEVSRLEKYLQEYREEIATLHVRAIYGPLRRPQNTLGGFNERVADEVRMMQVLAATQTLGVDAMVGPIVTELIQHVTSFLDKDACSTEERLEWWNKANELLLRLSEGIWQIKRVAKLGLKPAEEAKQREDG